MLEVGGLTVTLHGITILRSVTLTIEPGRIVGLIGRNGAGKTTTLRLLAGVLFPEGGFAHVLGESLWQAPPEKKARLAYVDPGVGGVQIELVGPGGSVGLRQWMEQDFASIVQPPPPWEA